MKKVSEATDKFQTKQTKKLEETDIEQYFTNEGYTWNYFQLTIPLLTNFLDIKGVKFSKSKLKRADYVQLAKDFIIANPIPVSMSVYFDPDEMKFIQKAIVSHQSINIDPLLPEVISPSQVPYQFNQVTTRNEDGEIKVTVENSRVLGTCSISRNSNHLDKLSSITFNNINSNINANQIIFNNTNIQSNQLI